MDRAQREALNRDLARLAAGDRHAFHAVFVRLWPLVRGFVHRHLPAADAEDAAQEALLKVFARASQFDPRRDALARCLRSCSRRADARMTSGVSQVALSL